MDNTKRLINECVLFQMEFIRKEMDKQDFNDQLVILCQCTEILSRAYQNINANNKNQEETKNESN